MKVDSASYYHSEKKAFNDVVTFMEPTSGAGLAVTLKNKTKLCGHTVYSLQKDDLDLNLPKSTADYIRVPPARNRFLDPYLHRLQAPVSGHHSHDGCHQHGGERGHKLLPTPQECGSKQAKLGHIKLAATPG